MNVETRQVLRSFCDNSVKTVDDVTQVVDHLSACVIWLEIDEKQKGEVFDALQSALKAIERTQ